MKPVSPGKTWTTKTPAQVGLDAAQLSRIQAYLGGRGCIVRYGYMVHAWGDQALRADIASAAKPFYAHFLFKAVETGRIPNVDQKVAEWDARLNHINASLGHKDRAITWRQMANQTSCYGVQEDPGTAYDYNDWQMALFWDTLFLKVYGTTYATVDADVFHPLLTGLLRCEDNPTMMAFGTDDRPGRVAISVRDHARFGLLYLRRGRWKGLKILNGADTTTAVSSPLTLSIPRTTGIAAEMISDQRSIGSTIVPDNQCDHDGGYSWLWWVNGVRRNGQRKWPDAPSDAFAALGHKNGKRGVAVVPSLNVVVAWNDTTLDQRRSDPHPLNEVFRLLCVAASGR